ncbi:shikimate dehydrogenase [Salsipaludibacter albus]|uniref:shikimate dehydrogenase n=1 Tax=Salsipaludibacter albus TaxID=2849650 RepID=UPI001EE3B8F5|nr:shikimate dehydrogenase [Salsipaludibacter albus]
MRRRVITSSTGLLAVIGHPVAHSVSPAMHNAAIAAAGLDLVYVALDVVPASLPGALDGLVSLGLRGANVTVPHKQAVMSACVDLTATARAVGAVNTLTVTDAGLVGDNTDVAGFLAGLGDLVVDRAVVLGSGGAARAVVAALVGRGTTVTVVARDPGRGHELVAAVGASSSTVAVTAVDRTEHVAAAVAGSDLVVNATPLGWHGERLPAPLHELHPGQLAYDCNYASPPSPFLTDARRAGAATVDGLEMVVGQAAAALQGWTGTAPDVDAMRSAARDELAARADGGGEGS